MARSSARLAFLSLGLVASTQLMFAAPGWAGGDGTAGGNSGNNSVGGSALTPIGTTTFSPTVTSQTSISQPVATQVGPALATALQSAGITQAGADGTVAVLRNETVNGVSPQQGAVALIADLTSSGAPVPQVTALVEALAALGATPTVQALNSAVEAFNQLVNTTDEAGLAALQSKLLPLRSTLLAIANAVS